MWQLYEEDVMGYVLSFLCFDWQAYCLLVLLPNMNVQAFNNRHDHNKRIKVNSRLGNICSESSMWHHRCNIPVFLMGKTWNVFWCQMRTDVPRNYITTQPGCATWEGPQKTFIDLCILFKGTFVHDDDAPHLYCQEALFSSRSVQYVRHERLSSCCTMVLMRRSLGKS